MIQPARQDAICRAIQALSAIVGPRVRPCALTAPRLPKRARAKCSEEEMTAIDGTGLSRYTWMREAIYRATTEPKLFTEASA